MRLFVSWTGPDFLRSLDVKVHWLQGQVFAPSTRLTYMHISASCTCVFCNLADITLTSTSVSGHCLSVIAFLSERLSYNSIKQYINVVRILHLEAGHVNPFLSCWHIDTLLKGTKRVLGVSIKQKLSITVYILRRMFTLVDLSCPLDVTFWASCLVALFSFFRNSNLLVKGMDSFIHSVHLCRRDANFSPVGVTLSVHWLKTFQYRQRTLHVPLPRVLGSPLCPSQALILSVRLCNSPPWAPLFTYPTRLAVGYTTDSACVSSILITYLSTLGINASDYSGLRFRRGGATFALECGIPTEATTTTT